MDGSAVGSLQNDVAYSIETGETLRPVILICQDFCYRMCLQSFQDPHTSESALKFLVNNSRLPVSCPFSLYLTLLDTVISTLTFN
jgi:hypothetical protein